MLSKKSLSLFLLPVLGIASFGFLATGLSGESKDIKEASAAYTPSTYYSVSDTASELASYYSSITTQTGSSLLSALRSLNSTKRKKTVGYSGMGTAASSSAFTYTDYPLGTTTKDANGQIRGSSIASFYTRTTATSFNREHMWPNSHGGNLVEADILHTRPTISSENSSRGNSFYVEGVNSSSAGWDPYTAGYAKEVRGECARVILYCVVASSQLNLYDGNSHSTSNSNKDYLMGDIDTLIKWHYDYSPNEYEINRNNGAEYLQGNRNPFVDHPEYVAKIWGVGDSSVTGYTSAVNSYCTSHSSMYNSWTAGSYSTYGTNDATTGGGGGASTEISLSISKTSASLTVGGSTSLTATVNNYTGTDSVRWYVEDSSTDVVTLSATTGNTITVNAVGAGSKKVYCYLGSLSAYCTVTVTSSGGSGGGSGSSGTYTITFAETSDQSSALASNNIDGVIESNSLVSSWTTLTKCYEGAKGLKLGSSSAVGSFTAVPVNDAKTNVTSITIKSAKYGSDTGTLSFKNGSTQIGNSWKPGNDFNYDASSSPLSISEFTIATSSKRAYVSSITFTVGSSGGGSTSSDSITLEDTTLSLTVGGSATIDYTASGSVTWKSSNSSVASVNNGTVTAVGAGQATITATCGTASATCTVTVSDPEASYVSVATARAACLALSNKTYGGTYVVRGIVSEFDYTKAGALKSVYIHDTDGTGICVFLNGTDLGLSAGRLVTISGTIYNFNGLPELTSPTLVATSHTQDVINPISVSNVSSIGSNVGNLLTTSAIYKSSGSVTNGVDDVFTLGSGTFNLYSSYTSSAVESYNSLKSGWTANSTEVELVGIGATFTQNSSTTYEILLTGSTVNTIIASDYSSDFLASITCDSTGSTAPKFTSPYASWSELASAYSALSSSEQSVLTSMQANKNGSTAQQAVAKYDYIVGKYGTEVYEDFMGRNPEPLGMNNPNLFNFGSNTNTTTLVVVLVSALSITAISVIIFIKKGKRD